MFASPQGVGPSEADEQGSLSEPLIKLIFLIYVTVYISVIR